MKLFGFLIGLLIGLKLAGIISWSWWWVFAPIWLPIVIEVLYVGGCRVLEWLLDNAKY
ncbi:MAG: hypothetical protein E7262_09630 [Lachnospiraceae bacterium]|nr:hypothetical protein [Lachnospiraceae bacterium]